MSKLHIIKVLCQCLIEKRMYEKYEYISVAYELISTVLLCIAHMELHN